MGPYESGSYAIGGGYIDPSDIQAKDLKQMQDWFYIIPIIRRHQCIGCKELSTNGLKLATRQFYNQIMAVIIKTPKNSFSI